MPEFLARYLAVAALAAMALLLGLFPHWWAVTRTKRQTDEWSFPYLSMVDGLERRWRQYPAPPSFETGMEASVRAYLDKWPEVVAFQRRTGPENIWIRAEDRVISIQPSQDPRLAGWLRAASGLEAGGTWSPPPSEDPDRAMRPMTILAGENWLILKRWDIGSPAAEGILASLSAHPPMIRIGLFPAYMKLRNQPESTNWGQWPNIQIDAAGVARSRWVQEGRTSMFGEEWIFYSIPAPALETAFRTYFRWQLVWGALGSLAVSGLVVFIWVRRQRHLRAREKEADRLAALTHSLKTPLSVVKLRCDLLRFSPGDSFQVKGELMALSEDVERLASTIDNGLRLFKESHLGGTGQFREVIHARWLEELVSELDASFQGHGREIRIDLCEGAIWASPATLRVALQTVLENSLEHGEGVTVLRTIQEGQRIQVRVEDSGPGMPWKDFQHLGQLPHRSGFSPSKGLGLNLLGRVAEDEGWGVELRSDLGQGFSVVIEVPAAPQDTGEGRLD